MYDRRVLKDTLPSIERIALVVCVDGFQVRTRRSTTVGSDGESKATTRGGGGEHLAENRHGVTILLKGAYQGIKAAAKKGLSVSPKAG